MKITGTEKRRLTKQMRKEYSETEREREGGKGEGRKQCAYGKIIIQKMEKKGKKENDEINKE